MSNNHPQRLKPNEVRSFVIWACTFAAAIIFSGCASTPTIAPHDGTVAAYKLDQHTESLALLALERDAVGRPRPSSALDFYLELGELGLAQVYGAIGALYMQGAKGSPDYANARSWLEKSSQVGQPLGTHNLGYLHERGLGTERNLSRAIELYRTAALSGFAPSMFNLGVLAATPEGAPQDPIEALKWFRLAVQHTEPHDGDLKKAAMLRAERLASQIDEEAAREADRRAVQWAEQMGKPR